MTNAAEGKGEGARRGAEGIRPAASAPAFAVMTSYSGLFGFAPIIARGLAVVSTSLAATPATRARPVIAGPDFVLYVGRTPRARDPEKVRGRFLNLVCKAT